MHIFMYVKHVSMHSLRIHDFQFKNWEFFLMFGLF